MLHFYWQKILADVVLAKVSKSPSMLNR